MSSVTEASTSALGKQGGMLFFLVFQGAKLAVCVFVRMGVAPGVWIKAEIVRGESVGVCQLPEPVSDSSSRQRWCIERDCRIRTLRALFVAQGDHHRSDAQGRLPCDAGSSGRHR